MSDGGRGLLLQMLAQKQHRVAFVFGVSVGHEWEMEQGDDGDELLELMASGTRYK